MEVAPDTAEVNENMTGGESRSRRRVSWKKIQDLAKMYEKLLRARNKAIEILREYEKQQELANEAHRLGINVKIKNLEKTKKAQKFLREIFPRVEIRIAELLLQLSERDPATTVKIGKLLTEIAREYEYLPLVTDILEVQRIRAYSFKHFCRNGKTCDRICERAKIFKDRIIVKEPITIVKHIDVATGRSIGAEILKGHRRVRVTPDPYVETNVIRTYETRIIKNKSVVRKARKLGYYCPFSTASIEYDTEPTTPESAPDHYPQDVIAELDDRGRFVDIKHSPKHGSEVIAA